MCSTLWKVCYLIVFIMQNSTQKYMVLQNLNGQTLALTTTQNNLVFHMKIASLGLLSIIRSTFKT